jgi:hypothetical protein
MRRVRRLLLIAGWIVFGLLTAASMIALVSIPYVIVVTGSLAVILGKTLDRHGGASHAVWSTVGVAALPLFLAYSNRHGPGTYCQSIGRPPYVGQECGTYFDPRPFVLAAVALLIAPATVPGFRRLRRPG